MDEKQIKQLKAKGENVTKEWEIDGFFVHNEIFFVLFLFQFPFRYALKFKV
jgi:hypothetical protein